MHGQSKQRKGEWPHYATTTTLIFLALSPTLEVPNWMLCALMCHFLLKGHVMLLVGKNVDSCYLKQLPLRWRTVPACCAYAT